MIETSSRSDGCDAPINQNEFDAYLQAVFGYIEPQGYDIVSSNLRVIKYSKGSPEFWSYLRHFIHFASKYKSQLNEDLVLVIQDGASICCEILSCLEKAGVKSKYLFGPAKCFVITMISPLRNASSHTVGHNILQTSGFHSLIGIGGSYEIYVRPHSMLDICSNLFKNPYSITKTQKVVAEKDGLGTKLPDYSAFPKYLPLIRYIQGVPFIPTFMIETGAGDQTVKVEVDCITTILGVRFMVESVLGINARMVQSSQELESIEFIVFDVSVGAMSDLFNSLIDNHEKALASIVLKRKAQFKLDEVEAIRQLKECVDGNGGYESLCNSIAKQYRQRMKHDRMRHLNAPGIPKTSHVKKVLDEYGFQTAKLIDEGKYYQDLIKRCDESADYFGVQELLDRDTIRKAEAFVMQQLYRRRTVQTVTEENQQELILPITALSSTPWPKQEKIVIPSDILDNCFDDISLYYTEGVLEQYVVKLRTPWEHLREDARASVALLNRPYFVPKKEALEYFQQLSEDQSQGPPLMTTRLKQWTIKGLKVQLTEWNIPSDGTHYSLMIKLFDKYIQIKRSSPSSPRMLSTEFPTPSGSVSNLAKDLPPNVANCLNTLKRSKAEKLLQLLLQDELGNVLQEFNNDELALEGLRILFQEDLPVVRYMFTFSESLILDFLRARAKNRKQRDNL